MSYNVDPTTGVRTGRIRLLKKHRRYRKDNETMEQWEKYLDSRTVAFIDPTEGETIDDAMSRGMKVIHLLWGFNNK